MAVLQDDIKAIANIGAVPTILQVVQQVTGLGFAVVARVTSDSWTACAVLDSIDFGMKPGDQLPIEKTLCTEVHQSGAPVIIDHVNQDTVFCGHPVPKLYGFQSYIAVPIYRRNGEYFGNLCALDPNPARLRDGKTLSMFQLFTELISLQLASEERLADQTAQLALAESAGDLREQFIAVLGHDLRSPLSAIKMGAELIATHDVPESTRRVAQRIERSADRIVDLVEDVLDFARGRLGGGIAIEPARHHLAELERRVRGVLDEIGTAHPGRTLRLTTTGSGDLACDAGRVEQVVSNLVGNALVHGAAQSPVSVGLEVIGGTLTVTVENQGALSDEIRHRLFQPFVRGGRQGKGLGLGLYIVAEIARAHGGSVDVDSSHGTTRFVVRLPTGTTPR
jgi:signal transduction histidine kinase